MPGRWTHSFEEDHDGITVYRRDDFAFPPARGRRGVEFRPDGTWVDWVIGRGDAPEARPAGRWDATGRITRDPGHEPAAGRIVTAEPDRLEIIWN
ncbi:hypothetical protein ACGFIF_38885 [Kribbella sp. NPDC049174]|uniref:hypothetical protein n=1 Tax=Kribbella sp. NPDC049174 TaxID=3364112 RepID=UPI003718A0D1